MKKLIFLLCIIVDARLLCFGGPTPEQIKKACVLLDLIPHIVEDKGEDKAAEFFENELAKIPKTYPNREDVFCYRKITLSFYEHFVKRCYWKCRAAEVVKIFRTKILNDELTTDEDLEKHYIRQLEINFLSDQIMTPFMYGTRNTDLITETSVLRELMDLKRQTSTNDFQTLVKKALEPEWNGIALALAEENPEYFLFAAIKTGNEAVFTEILKRNPQINIRNENGFTPLMLAIGKQNYAFTEQLLLRGADIDTNFPEGNFTALDFAVHYNGEKIVQLLLENKANPNVYIHTETRKSIIMRLLEAGMDIENIPQERLDDDMLKQYILTCQKRFPQEFEGITGKDIFWVFFRLITEGKINFSRNHIKMLFVKLLKDEDEEETTRLPLEVTQETHEKQEDTPKPQNKSPKKTSDPYIRAEMNRISCALRGTPSTGTQNNRNKAATASAKKAQRGASTTPPKLKATVSVPQEPYSIIFKLTPDVRSRDIDGDKAMKIVNEVLSILKIGGMTIHVSSKEHRMLKVGDTIPEWAKGFFETHAKVNQLAQPHPGTKIRTDHYDDWLSYLFHFVCLLACQEGNPHAESAKELLLKYEAYLIKKEIDASHKPLSEKLRTIWRS